MSQTQKKKPRLHEANRGRWANGSTFGFGAAQVALPQSPILL
jgi:hypothetical protein